MDLTAQINSLLAGPCLYISLTLCITGLVRKALIISEGRSRGMKFPVYRSADGADAHPLSLTGGTPFTAAVSVIFHIAVIAAPLTARGHGILLDMSWGVLPPRFNPVFTTSLTALAVAAGVTLLLRRIFTRHVRALSTWRDYAVMACVLVPFITGLMAKGMMGNYEAVMLIHYISGHILLVSLGWTGLGHFVLFTAAFSVTSGFRIREGE